jgi:hypothetical protein
MTEIMVLGAASSRFEGRVARVPVFGTWVLGSQFLSSPHPSECLISGAQSGISNYSVGCFFTLSRFYGMIFPKANLRSKHRSWL